MIRLVWARNVANEMVFFADMHGDSLHTITSQEEAKKAMPWKRPTSNLMRIRRVNI